MPSKGKSHTSCWREQEHTYSQKSVMAELEVGKQCTESSCLQLGKQTFVTCEYLFSPAFPPVLAFFYWKAVFERTCWLWRQQFFVLCHVVTGMLLFGNIPVGMSSRGISFSIFTVIKINIKCSLDCISFILCFGCTLQIFSTPLAPLDLPGEAWQYFFVLFGAIHTLLGEASK